MIDILGIPVSDVLRHYLGPLQDDFLRFVIHFPTYNNVITFIKSLDKREDQYKCEYKLTVRYLEPSSSITAVLTVTLPTKFSITVKTVTIRKKEISLYDKNGPKLLQRWITTTEDCYYKDCEHLYSENCPNHIP